MKNYKIVAHKDKLDALFQKIGSIDDLELQSHWARYLCILISGFIEFSVRVVFVEYVQGCSSPSVINYVEKKLGHFQNPKMNRILELSGNFKPLWKDELKKATDGELKDAIDSIVANKNNIVHGNSVGITYGRVKTYYGKAIQVIELLEDQCI